MKKYIHIEGEKHLKVEIYYSKGGMNYFNYKVEPRGYWLSVSPVEVTRSGSGVTMESYAAFSGKKVFLLEVKRQSDKAMTQAIEKSKEYEQAMIELFNQ